MKKNPMVEKPLRIKVHLPAFTNNFLTKTPLSRGKTSFNTLLYWLPSSYSGFLFLGTLKWFKADEKAQLSLNKKFHYETKSTTKEDQLWSKRYLFLGSISLEQLAEWTKTLYQFKYLKHKIKENFFYKIRQKNKDIYLFD